MAKYRKRPVVIDAFQMTKERRWDNSEWPNWMHNAWNRRPGEGSIWPDPDAPITADNISAEKLVCGTLDGVHSISSDDWITKGVNGEIDTVDPDIFEKTYEEVIE